MHESGKRRGVGTVALDQAQQADERVGSAAGIDLELRVKAVRQRQRRVERQRALERRFGRSPGDVSQGSRRGVLRDHAMAARQAGPGRREIRRLLDARLIEVARGFPVIGFVRRLIGTRIELLRPRAGRLSRRASARTSRHRVRPPPAARTGSRDAAPSRCTPAHRSSASSRRSVDTLTVRFASSTAVSGQTACSSSSFVSSRPGVAEKHDQRVEDLRRDRDRYAIARQPLFAGVDTKAPETIDGRSPEAFSKTFSAA